MWYAPRSLLRAPVQSEHVRDNTHGIFCEWWYAPQRALHKTKPRHTVISAPEILGHLFRLVAAVALFELVVVAVGVVCAFVVVVFVDEDAFLAGDRLAAVLAAGVFPAQDEEPED